MKIVNGRLDYQRPWSLPDVYLFTGNTIVKNNGALVMGAGAAKQIRDAYPGIDGSFGKLIKRLPEAHILWVAFENPQQHLGWFKVKYHWADDADLDLIAESARRLAEIARSNPFRTYHLNYPGVGNGRLREAQVEPLLQVLPDNVIIYR